MRSRRSCRQGCTAPRPQVSPAVRRKSLAEMLSSTTTHATPRLLLWPEGPPAQGRREGRLDARALVEGFCSPAGLHRRPWLARLRRALAEDLFVLHFQPIV